VHSSTRHLNSTEDSICCDVTLCLPIFGSENSEQHCYLHLPEHAVHTRNSQYRVYETIQWHSGDGISTKRCVWEMLAMTHTYSALHLLCLLLTNWRPLKMMAMQSFGTHGPTHPTTRYHHPNAWIYGNTATRIWNLTQNEVSSYLRDWRPVPQDYLLLESVHIVSHIGTPARKHILIFCSDSHRLSPNYVQIRQ